MEINLSKMLDDACTISLAIACKSMFYTEIQSDECKAKEYLEKYLPDYANILIEYFDKKEQFEFSSDSIIRKREIIEEKMRDELEKNKQFSDDDLDLFIHGHYEKRKRLEPDKLFNSGIYNLAFLLLSIDRCEHYDKDILYCNSFNEYDKGMSLLIKKMEMLCMIHLGISHFIIERDQRNNAFEWGKHYNVALNMHNTICNQEKYQVVKEICYQDGILTPTEGKCFISDILLFIDFFRVKQQCSLERLMVALVFISESFEYPEWMNQYAASLVDILNEILFCGKILHIYFQEGYYNSWSSQEKTSSDATTRLSIIFAARNDDIFIMRIDLPHKGENSFHINMEEVVGEKILSTGYPLDFHDSQHLREILGNSFEELFFEMNERFWFRSQFGFLLKKTVLSDEQRQTVNEAFHKQSHMKIPLSVYEEKEDCEKQLLFVNEIKEYIKRFRMKDSSFLVFKKGDIDYCSEVLKIRSLFWMEKKFLKRIVIARREELVSCNKVFKDFMKMLNREYEEEKDFSLIELWEKIENELAVE